MTGHLCLVPCAWSLALIKRLGWTNTFISIHVVLGRFTFIKFIFQEIRAIHGALITTSIRPGGTPRRIKRPTISRNGIIFKAVNTRTGRHRPLDRKLLIVRFINGDTRFGNTGVIGIANGTRRRAATGATGHIAGGTRWATGAYVTLVKTILRAPYLGTVERIRGVQGLATGTEIVDPRHRVHRQFLVITDTAAL